MFPYIQLPPISAGQWHISWFVPLLVCGIAAGAAITVRRARTLGIPSAEAVNLLWVLLLGGWLGAGFGKALYEPALIRADPTLLYRYYFGISSFGGIFGGIAATGLYCAFRRIPWTPFADAASFAFPFAWIFGRLACTLAHDHPGIYAQGWFTVAYPAGSRYDLGLLELLFTIVLAVIWLFWVQPDATRARRPAGMRTGVLLAAYGLLRIAIDPLHVDPPRYGGISVDQAAGSLAILIGSIIIARVYSVHRRLIHGH